LLESTIYQLQATGILIKHFDDVLKPPIPIPMPRVRHNQEWYSHKFLALPFSGMQYNAYILEKPKLIHICSNLSNPMQPLDLFQMAPSMLIMVIGLTLALTAFVGERCRIRAYKKKYPSSSISSI
jgi:hypothetical protein